MIDINNERKARKIKFPNIVTENEYDKIVKDTILFSFFFVVFSLVLHYSMIMHVVTAAVYLCLVNEVDKLVSILFFLIECVKLDSSTYIKRKDE